MEWSILYIGERVKTSGRGENLGKRNFQNVN